MSCTCSGDKSNKTPNSFRPRILFINKSYASGTRGSLTRPSPLMYPAPPIYIVAAPREYPRKTPQIQPKYGPHTPPCVPGLRSRNLISMTELFNLSDLSEPAEYHQHGGEEVPVYLVHSLIQEPRKEPENIEFGLLCVACGLTPTPRVARMWLEMELGLEPSEQPAPEPDEEDEWPCPHLGLGPGR